MISRIKRAAAWLILSIAVFCLTAGCSVSSVTQEVGTAADQTVQAETSPETAKSKTEKHKTAAPKETSPETTTTASAETGIDQDGSYNTKDEVALYLHTYGRLPDNYITKKEAQKLGWDSKKGNLTEVAPGKSIGGSHFGNYEEQLPEKDGRKYYECDLEYDGGYRGAKRIIYSNDGLIFYTEDHYKTFEQLY